MPPRIEIIGDVEKASPFISWAKQQWSLREGRWHKHTGTCLIELFRAGDTGLIRIIHETVAGFVGHPRTGKLKQLPFWNNGTDQKYLTGVDGGGYFEKNGTWEEIANRTPYPLEDSDFGTFLLEKEVEWMGNTDNYGNCWWTDGYFTLSWKANPNWQFSLDSSVNIPGLSRPENKVGGILYYTCFSNNIYEAGEVLAVGPVTPPAFGSDVIEPSLIAGAWYYNGSLLCCSVINKADTVGGYWLGIYKQDGEEWELIGTEFPSSRLHTPAFISTTGLTIIQGDFKYTLNTDITEVKQTALNTFFVGSRIITGSGGYGSTYKYNTLAKYWAGLTKEDTVEISTVTTDAIFNYSSVGNVIPNTKLIPVYRGNPATEGFLDIVGANSISKAFAFRANGAYCSVQFSVTGSIFISSYSGPNVVVATNEGEPLCGTLTATAISKEDIIVSVDVLDGAVWASSTDYTLLHSVDPTGWTIDEYNYISATTRAKVVSVASNLEFVDTLGMCQGNISEGWSEFTYRVAGSYGPYSGCFGAILTTTFLNSSATDFCYVTAEEVSVWQNGGALPCTYGGSVYAFYATGGNCPSSYPCVQDNGDTVIAIIGGFSRIFRRQSRRRNFVSYTCQLEVLQC